MGNGQIGKREDRGDLNSNADCQLPIGKKQPTNSKKQSTIIVNYIT